MLSPALWSEINEAEFGKLFVTAGFCAWCVMYSPTTRPWIERNLLATRSCQYIERCIGPWISWTWWWRICRMNMGSHTALTTILWHLMANIFIARSVYDIIWTLIRCLSMKNTCKLELYGKTLVRISRSTRFCKRPTYAFGCYIYPKSRDTIFDFLNILKFCRSIWTA